MIIHIDGIDREATAKELEVIKAEQTAVEKELLLAETNRVKAKADVLAKLGLTADEVAALLS